MLPVLLLEWLAWLLALPWWCLGVLVASVGMGSVAGLGAIWAAYMDGVWYGCGLVTPGLCPVETSPAGVATVVIIILHSMGLAASLAALLCAIEMRDPRRRARL